MTLILNSHKPLVRALRLQGVSLTMIHKVTGVPKSTIRFWCQDIIPTIEQKLALETLRIKKASARLKSIQDIRRDSNERLKERLRTEGKEDIKNLRNNPLFFTGLGLYWGEGYKNGNQEVGITNSDPSILIVAMRWFNQIYKIKNDEFVAKLTINSSYKDRADKILRYWSKILSIPLSQFTKTTFINTPFKRIYKNQNHKGTVRIKISKPMRLRERLLSSIKHVPNLIK